MKTIDWYIKPAVALFAVVALLQVQGCGTITGADYALVTEGDVSSRYIPFVGGNVEGCKVTRKGDVNGWVVTYKGEKCTAELHGGTDENSTQ